MWQYNHNDELYHFGVKGMKWGVRNGPPYPLDDNLNTYKIHGDGRIEIKKGTEIQRLVSKTSRQSIDGMTYASFTNNDNARYMHGLNNKKTLGKQGVHNIKLTLKVENDLKSPSNDEATKIFFEMLRDNPKLNQAYSNVDLSPIGQQSRNGQPYSKDEINNILNNPSKAGKLPYYTANASLILDEMVDVRNAYFNKLQQKGYNMLHDVNDAWTGVSKNPVIILDGSKSLSISSKDFVDKQMVKSAFKYDQETIKLGRKWLKENGFNEDVLLE